jgi:hypothetical protein
MIFTHTGLMGDFVQTWPIASWYYKQTGEKITFVLADIPCFKDIAELTLNQPFTKEIIKVPHKIENYRMGGQPYKFNPSEFGIKGEYLNLGFRDYPREEWVPYFMAAEYDLGVDLDYVINVSGIEASTNEIVVNRPFIQSKEAKKIYDDCGKREWGHFMLSNYIPSQSKFLTGEKSLYADLVTMKQAKHTYVSEGGLAVLIDLMDINYTIYYKEKPAHPGWWMEQVYYKPNNPKRQFIAIPEEVNEPKIGLSFG